MTSLRRIAAAAATTFALGAGALLAAPAATAVPGEPETNRAVVDAWYADFLGRDAGEDAGSQYWVDTLSAGFPEGDALWLITHSEEFDSTTIDLYYRALLDRSPDPGARYWIDGINAQRFPAEWALQNILASQEFFRGKDTTTVVNGYYDVMLGRAPSAGEVAYWSNRLTAVGALGTVREIYYTGEAVTLRIVNSYEGLLGRAPEQRELYYWYPKQVENSVNVQVLIASTAEYRDLATSDDED